MNRRFNFIFVNLIAIVLLAAVFTGCSKEGVEKNREDSSSAVKAGYSDITPEEAKKRLDGEEGIILLDVRTPEEYQEGHIKEAVLIPLDTLEEEAKDKLADKDAVIFVYCRSGRRSVDAANILVELGYKKVYNLGGIIDWPYEIVK